MNNLNEIYVPDIQVLADVQPQNVTFLWYPYIPLGKITLIEGDPSAGKTFLSMAISAAVSNEMVLPRQNGQLSESVIPGRVLYLSAEDDPADTIAPRLVQMGANTSRILLSNGYRFKDDQAKDSLYNYDLNLIAPLRRALDEYRPVLVILDPLQAFLGKTRVNNMGDVRNAMGNLKQLADEFGCAIICIRHFNKAAGMKANYRGAGSIDFFAIARSVLQVGKNPYDQNERIMVQTKNNCAKPGIGQKFAIGDEGSFSWRGSIDISPDELLDQPTTKTTQWDTQALKEAEIFLHSILINGPVSSHEIKEQAQLEGIPVKKLQQAKKELGVTSIKRTESGAWYWTLPRTGKQPYMPDVGGGTIFGEYGVQAEI